MFRKAWRVVAGLGVVALAAGTLAVPSGASTRTQTQGVTKDDLQMVIIVPDLDALIARGFNVGSGTTQGFADRFIAHSEAYGPIRGREMVVDKVGWDPLDTTSFDKACTQAVIDRQPFVVINSSGFRDSSIPCVTVDNDTPYMTGDMAQGTLQDASGNNLVTLGLPPEVAAKNAVRVLDKTGQLPKSAKIGIVSSNIPGLKVAGDTLEKELTKRGYNVVAKPELNGLASDGTLLRREAGQAATSFQSQGIDTVFNVQSLTQMTGYYDEATRLNYKPQVYSIDGQANTCVLNAAGRSPVEAEGMICITTFDGKAGLDGKGIKPDTEFEAECRENYEAKKKFVTVPGSPSSGLTVGGVKYEEDLSPFECTIAELLLPAIKKAGKNPTWAKVYKNMMAVENGPAAYMSNGEGSFGPNKPYFANQMHFMKLTRAGETTAKDANGTYNGCPIPAPCYVPFTVDGEEWFPISTK